MSGKIDSLHFAVNGNEYPVPSDCTHVFVFSGVLVFVDSEDEVVREHWYDDSYFFDDAQYLFLDTRIARAIQGAYTVDHKKGVITKLCGLDD